MPHAYLPASGWGPERKRAALSITFDNFGEAADIEHGMWDGQPVGQHYTAAFVPRLVDLLGDVRATYFVEASNCAIYPDALRLWRDAGHEIGIHGWRHERWAEQAPDTRRALLRRSLEAMRSIGLSPAGFRPPGGAIPAECWVEFEEAGLLYCSALGTAGVSRVGNMISVPFEWIGVDTFMLEDLLKGVRLRNGYREEPFDLAHWRAELDRAVGETLALGSQRTIIFHPGFLATSDEKLAVAEYLIELAQQADLWIAPVGEIARFCARSLEPAARTAA